MGFDSNKWKWGASAHDRWILIYSEDDDQFPAHFTWGYKQEDWCEHVFQWLKKVQLSKELEPPADEELEELPYPIQGPISGCQLPSM
eukprot:1475299-Amphidinium_carterae.1